MSADFLTKIDEEKINKKTKYFCGYEEVMNEIKRIVDVIFSKDNIGNDIAEILGINGTILLCGKPGEGKSTIGYNIAKYALETYEVECYKFSISDIVKSELGKSTYNITKVLNEIDKISKEYGAIIFIDEIDRLCVNRMDSKEISEMKRVLLEIMDFLDDLTINDKVIIIGITNIADSLDKALLRRFNYKKIIKSDISVHKSFITLLNRHMSIKIDKELIDKYCKSVTNTNCDYIKKIYKDSFMKFYGNKENFILDIENSLRKEIEKNVNDINKCTD